MNDPLTPRERRALTQRTGAQVRTITPERADEVGTVIGHYDDDSVFVQWADGSTERWWTDALRPVERKQSK